MQVEPGRFYTSDHEWVAFADDGTATVGISDYAQGKLGDLVYIEFLARSGHVSRGAAVVSLESVKAVAEAYAPFDAEVLAVNEELPQTPGWVNEDPYHKGWMLKLRPLCQDPKAGLMDANDYEVSLKGL